MEGASVTALAEHFAALADPRVERTKVHALLTIVTIAICAVVCGAETWNEIEEFGTAKAAWLGTFLDLTDGVPSHDQRARPEPVVELRPDRHPRGKELRCDLVVRAVRLRRNHRMAVRWDLRLEQRHRSGGLLGYVLPQLLQRRPLQA